MRDYLLFIVKNALRSKRRALLTVASVALSFCLLAVLMALYADSQLHLEKGNLLPGHPMADLEAVADLRKQTAH